MTDRTHSLFVTAALSTICTGHAGADVLVLEASQDNTLYEHPAGALSNGNGVSMFAGRTVDGNLRRAAVQFDVAGSIPAGSAIQSVSVTFAMTRTIAGTVDFSLHRFTDPWGEAGSTAVFGGGGGGGVGAAAMVGDVTWLHAFSPSTFWAQPGGDFDPTPSATLPIGPIGSYVFTGPGLVSDVQAWLDDPASNHGWILKDDMEGVVPITAKRFSTREEPTPSFRPSLEVTFDPPTTGTTFCNSLPNATGSEALLTAMGDPSSSLSLSSTPVPNTTGQFFFGPMMLGGSQSLGDGIRCVGGAVTRILPFVSAGMMMQAPNTAALAVSYSAPYAAGFAGTQYFQHWFRSGLATGAGSNTSSGVEIQF